MAVLFQLIKALTMRLFLFINNTLELAINNTGLSTLVIVKTALQNPAHVVEQPKHTHTDSQVLVVPIIFQKIYRINIALFR